MIRSRPSAERAVTLLGDQERFVTRDATVVLDKLSKRAIVVAGVLERSIQEEFAAMGWSLVDREEVE